LSVWWVLQLSWRFDHAVHSSGHRLRWAGSADRRCTASFPSGNGRPVGDQIDWCPATPPEEDWRSALDESRPGEACERLTRQQVSEGQRGSEAPHGQTAADAQAVSDQRWRSALEDG
jgi:hypothetical protein